MHLTERKHSRPRCASTASLQNVILRPVLVICPPERDFVPNYREVMFKRAAVKG